MYGTLSFSMPNESTRSLMIPYVENIINIPTKPQITAFFPSSFLPASAVMSFTTPHAKYMKATEKRIRISGFNIAPLTLLRKGMMLIESMNT